MRWTLSIAPVLLTLSIGCPDGAAITRTETRTVPLKAGGELRVKGFNGQIRVETWAKEEVEVQAEIRENEQGEVTLRTEGRDGLAEIIGERRGSDQSRGFHFQFGSAGISYVLRVPVQSRAHLETSNGQILVQGLQGDLDARTSNGQVELRNLGSGVTVRTSNGSVQIESIAGSADITTTNGAVEAKAVKGELKVHTSNGFVEARGVEGKTYVHTSNGAIVLEDLKAPAVAESSNGSLRAERLADDLRVSTTNAGVELRDVAGQVDVRTSHGSLQARGLSGKGRGIRLQTSNADLTLDLGSIQGEVVARTSGHERVDIQRPGLAPRGNPDKGQAEITLAGSDQRVELITSNGTITIR